MLQEAGLPPQVKDMVEGWLARARNPASRMEAQLQAAEEKIRQIEHEKNEELKIHEIKHQEQKMKIEQYEKVMMMMATEIKNLQDGKQPQIDDGKEKALREANDRLEKSKMENLELLRKLEEETKTKSEALDKVSTLTKVVEAVNNNVKEQRPSKNKKDINCRDYNTPKGCAWGSRCKFYHEEDQGLGKNVDCSYWMEGHCRFSNKVCWNKHNPAMKGSKQKKGQEVQESVFQGGQEPQRGGTENSASRMDSEGWEDAGSRRSKRRMRVTSPEKGRQQEDLTDPTFHKDGETGEMTPPFPVDGAANQQIILQALQALLRQAGVGM